MEFIKGQDHNWWIYSNKKDGYVDTGIAYKDMPKEKLKGYIEKIKIEDCPKEKWITEEIDV